jgi:hypothetical protein
MTCRRLPKRANKGAQELADSFRKLSLETIQFGINLEKANIAQTRSNTQEDRAFQLSQRQRGEEQSFSSGTGIGDAYLKAMSGQKVSKKEARLLGFAPPGIARDIAEGEAEMSRVTGMGGGELKTLESMGGISFGMLQSFANKAVSNKREDQLFGRQMVTQERGLGAQERTLDVAQTHREMAAQAAVIVTETPQAAVTKQAESGEGKAQKVEYTKKQALITLGKGELDIANAAIGQAPAIQGWIAKTFHFLGARTQGEIDSEKLATGVDAKLKAAGIDPEHIPMPGVEGKAAQIGIPPATPADQKAMYENWQHPIHQGAWGTPQPADQEQTAEAQAAQSGMGWKAFNAARSGHGGGKDDAAAKLLDVIAKHTEVMAKAFT